MCETQKVTVGDLKAIPVGDCKTFTLPDADAIHSGKSLAYRMQYSLDCRFVCESDFVKKQLTVKKYSRHD